VTFAKFGLSLFLFLRGAKIFERKYLIGKLELYTMRTLMEIVSNWDYMKKMKIWTKEKKLNKFLHLAEYQAEEQGIMFFESKPLYSGQKLLKSIYDFNFL
jgi:hypothetical protein